MNGHRSGIPTLKAAVGFAVCCGLAVASASAQDKTGKPVDASKSPLQKQITAILTTQAAAWNRGDIDAFMEYYWKSKQLTFSSGGKTTRGWKETKANYKRRYPTRDAMGRVSFSKIEVTPIGDAGALVLGRWKLKRKSDPVGGNFSLVFRRIGKRWLIIHDHTSRDAKKPAPGGDTK